MTDRDAVPALPSVFDANRWIGRLAGRPTPDPTLLTDAAAAEQAHAALERDPAPDPADVARWEQAELDRLLRLRGEAEAAVARARGEVVDTRRRYAALPRPEPPGGAVPAGILGVLGVGVGLALPMRDLFAGSLPDLQGIAVGAAIGALLAALPVFGMLRAARHEPRGWGLGWSIAALAVAVGMLSLRVHLHPTAAPAVDALAPGAAPAEAAVGWSWHAGGLGPLTWLALGFTVLELATLASVHTYARGLARRHATWAPAHHAHTVARRRFDAAEEHLDACTALLDRAEARVERWLTERRRRVDVADLAHRKGEAAAGSAALGQRVGAEEVRRDLVGADTRFPSRAEALDAVLTAPEAPDPPARRGALARARIA